MLYSSPGLYIASPQTSGYSYAFSKNILHEFVHAKVLPDRANRNTASMIEVRVLDENWRLLGGCAVVLAPVPYEGPGDGGVPSRRDADGPTR